MDSRILVHGKQTQNSINQFLSLFFARVCVMNKLCRFDYSTQFVKKYMSIF